MTPRKKKAAKKRPAKKRATKAGAKRERSGTALGRPRRPLGRPTKLTTFVAFLLIHARREGALKKYAARAARVSPDKVEDWLDRARDYREVVEASAREPSEVAADCYDAFETVVVELLERAREMNRAIDRAVRHGEEPPPFRIRLDDLQDIRATHDAHYLAFLDLYEANEAEFVHEAVQRLRRAEPADLRWLLERSFQEDYMQRKVIETDEPIEIDLTLQVGPPMERPTLTAPDAE